MKTKLPKSINSLEEAKGFLLELHRNKESYHPEDDAYDIVWDLPDYQTPTYLEKAKLNDLMEQVYAFTTYNEFDPCEFLLKLDQDAEVHYFDPSEENSSFCRCCKHISDKSNTRRLLP